MKSLLFVLGLLLPLWLGTAVAETVGIREENRQRFSVLLHHLVSSYETLSAEDDRMITEDLEAIRSVSGEDYELALAISGHWRSVFGSGYILRIHHGTERAEELETTALQNSRRHAFVVLGYQLQNGEMTRELKGRCEAAAAAARSFPDALIVCSGGATGSNNPEGHTEAGMMKAYLTGKCGIAADRILTDEEAMTTAENAVNTFRMLMENDVKSITVVTSSYHQRWGQVLCNAMAALYRRWYGYSVDIVENYCYDIQTTNKAFQKDERMAERQLRSLLGLQRK